MTTATSTATSPDSLAEQDIPSGAAVDTASRPEPATEPAESTDSPAPAPAPKRGRKPSAARKTRTVELTLTVTGTAEGEWQAELTHGGKRVVTGLAVAAAAVSRAAKELHPDISGEIDAVITAAREQHEARLAELQAELDKVKQALAELEN